MTDIVGPTDTPGPSASCAKRNHASAKGRTNVLPAFVFGWRDVAALKASACRRHGRVPMSDTRQVHPR